MKIKLRIKYLIDAVKKLSTVLEESSIVVEESKILCRVNLDSIEFSAYSRVLLYLKDMKSEHILIETEKPEEFLIPGGNFVKLIKLWTRNENDFVDLELAPELIKITHKNFYTELIRESDAIERQIIDRFRKVEEFDII